MEVSVLLLLFLLDSGNGLLRANFRISSSHGTVSSRAAFVCARKCLRDLECRDFRVDTDETCEFTNVASANGNVYNVAVKVGSSRFVFKCTHHQPHIAITVQ